MPTLLTPPTEIKLEWSDITKRRTRKRPKTERSSGVHVSGVIKYVLQASGSLSREDESDDMPICMAVGMAWEDWVVGLWPDIKWQPGELCRDGIYGSPDGLSGSVLEEFKATWKSVYTRQDITRERIWMWQLAAYMKMLGMTRARLHVLWLNGDYRPPKPRYVVYELQFTQEELDRFWDNVILKNKDKAQGEKH